MEKLTEKTSRLSAKNRRSVGQLAKTQFPTLKANPRADLALGRHEKNNLAHAPAHTGTLLGKQVFVPKYRIKMHNENYLLFLKSEFGVEQIEFFEQLIERYCWLRLTTAQRNSEEIFYTNDHDFLEAYNYVKEDKIKLDSTEEKPSRKQKNYPNKPIILACIQANFKHTHFRIVDVCKKLSFKCGMVSLVFTELIKQQYIFQIHQGIYQLNKNYKSC